jgi:hypothetical protein
VGRKDRRPAGYVEDPASVECIENCEPAGGWRRVRECAIVSRGVAMAETNEVPEWAAAALEEYKMQRAAILDTQGAAHRTLALGITAVGILVAGAFNVWDSSDELPATALFLVVIPVVSALVLLQWAGQILFLTARGKYVQDVERAIRQAYPLLPEKLFTWEDSFDERHWISGKWWKPDLRWYMHAATVVFQLIAVGSICLGVSKGWEPWGVGVLAIGCLVFVALIFVGVWVMRELTTRVSRE